MRIGLALPSYVAAGGDASRRLSELESEVALADSLGFSHVLLGHHYLTRSSFMQPLSLVAHLGRGTTQIRLGFGVLLLPLHAPVGLAEELTTLDVLLGGRLIVGVGAGYRPIEFAALEVPFDDRFKRLTRGIEVLQTLWRGDEVELLGRPDDQFTARLELLPIQPGGPPIWLGAQGPRGLKRVAETNTSWLGLLGTGGDDALRSSLAHVRMGLSDHTRSPDRPFPVIADTYVAESDRQALELARKFARPGLVSASASTEQARTILRQAVMTGSIETVGQRLRTWRDELGITDAVLRIDSPGAEPEQTHDMIRALHEVAKGLETP